MELERDLRVTNEKPEEMEEMCMAVAFADDGEKEKEEKDEEEEGIGEDRS